MDLNLLPVFVLVARTASFAEAGRALGLPRSSVSRRITELEGALGVRLFNRTTRTVALSTAGASLLERVAPQLADIERSLGTMPERDEQPSGDLRVTAPPDMGVTFLPAVFAGFARRYPAVRLDVRLSLRIADLVAEGYDLALRVSVRGMADSSLVARRLSDVDFALFAAPTYVARRGPALTPEETADHDWVTLRRQVIPRVFPRPTRPPRATSDDLLFVHQAVRAGLGVGLLPVFLAQPDVTAGHLVRLLPGHAFRTGTLYAVHPAGRRPPRKVVAFRDYIAAHLAAHPLSAPSSERG